MHVVRGNQRFEVRAGPHDEFWARFGSGAWEAATLAVFDRLIDRRTTVLDVGAWIGPTTLYAAGRARRVIAFEPDPVAFEELAANVALNPGLGTIEVHQACVAARRGAVRLGVDRRPGDSESSLLFGDGGAGWTVPAVGLAELIGEHRVERPLFIKMDVEGYEYELVPAIIDVLRVPGTVMHLSTHPRVFGQAAARRARSGVGRAFAKRVIGPLRGVAAGVRLAGALERGLRVHDEYGRAIRLRRGALRALGGGGFTPSRAVVVSAEPLGTSRASDSKSWDGRSQ